MTPGRPTRLLPLLGLLALLSPLAVAAQGSQPHIAGTVVGANGVNIRSCPRAECDVRAVALLGDRLNITGDAVDGFLPVEWGGVSGYAYTLYIATPDFTPQLSQGSPGCKRVAVIFNVGVGYESRIEILEALKADDIPATVFPMGWWAAKHPGLLKQIAEDGFPIGSHGDQRVNLTNLSDAAVKADIATATKAIERATGEPPEPYFTPYAAAIDERVRGMIARAGFLPVMYTLPADDWDFDADPDAIFMNVVPHVTDGAIVEFHLDAPASAESTAIALPWITERLRDKGFEFVTIPELARPCDAASTA